MYPNLYYLFKDLFGIELGFFKIVQSFGFFVALAFFIGSYLWAYQLKQKRKAGLLKPTIKKVLVGKKATASDYLSSGITGFIIGFKLGLLFTDYHNFINNPQLYLLSLKGNLLFGIFTMGLSLFWKHKELKKQELPEPKWIEQEVSPESHVGNMVMLAALFGIIGAKIFHLLENPDEIKTLFNSAQSFFSGLTMYGGLIVGGSAVLIYAKKNQLNLLQILDTSAPVLMIGYAIGRIGCQVSGDGDWGIENLSTQPGWLSFLPEWTWSYTYPHNVNGVGIPIEGCEGPYCFELPNPVWPTPLYETVMCLILFGVLWGLRTRIKTPGILFSIYLIFNGIERFLIEKIRVNEHLFGTNITQAEIISVILILLGAFGTWYFTKTKKNFLHNES